MSFQALNHNVVVVVLLTGGGGGGEAGVAGHGEAEHPLELHLVPVHLLLLLLPLEGPQPPDVRGAITGHGLTSVPLVRGEEAGGSSLRLHPGSYLSGRPRKSSLLSVEKRFSGNQSWSTCVTLRLESH